MALTMTRTRTQTTLTKLATMVGNLHGELEFLEALLPQAPKHQQGLLARKAALQAHRSALYLTLHQFDPELDPMQIGTSGKWLKAYGCREVVTKAATRRYLAAHENNREDSEG